MLPLIHGKDLLECSLEDLQSILDDISYRESEYLDYKGAYVIDKMPKGPDREKKVAELRTDICAFANADGGYMFFGVTETGGIPQGLPGYEVSNTERFERDFKDLLRSISPRSPDVKFHFVRIEEQKYIIIVRVYHDAFAPYIHLENDKDYRVFKRYGNSKVVIGYQELRSMFNQSLSLERSIAEYRRERIAAIMEQEDDTENTYSKFFLMHIIPDTFTDASHDKQVFVLERNKAHFGGIFNPFECDSIAVPIVEGLRFPGRYVKAECRICNNGIAEFFYPLQSKIRILRDKDPNGHLPYEWLWQNIDNSVRMYYETVNQHFGMQRFFVCISIIGCKNVITVDKFELDFVNRVDRNRLLCNPVVFLSTDDGKLHEEYLSRLHLEFLLSLGVRYDQTVLQITDKLYGAKESQ